MDFLVVLAFAVLAVPGAAPAPAPRALRVCTTNSPLLPISSPDPRRPGISQVLIGLASEASGIAIRNEFAPRKRCQVLVERGEYDAMIPAGYAGIHPTIAVFPMRDGRPDAAKSLGATPIILYRRVGSRAGLVGGRIVHTDKPVAVLVGHQVGMDAVARAGGSVDDGATTVQALAQKLLANYVDLVASAESVFAHQVATRYPGKIEALETPLVEAHYFLVFSKAYYEGHREQAEAFWRAIAHVKTRPEYRRAIGDPGLEARP